MDMMLYADLDLDVKMSDAITGIKESTKNPQAVKTEQVEASLLMNSNVTGAANNAVGGMQLDQNTILQY